jgi:hypothetical protein
MNRTYKIRIRCTGEPCFYVLVLILTPPERTKAHSLLSVIAGFAKGAGNTQGKSGYIYKREELMFPYIPHSDDKVIPERSGMI